jgi:manganese/zinc/iron transport system permease protein
VLCISAIVLLSLTLAPNRGLIWRWVRRQRNRRRLQAEAVLADLYLLASQHEDRDHGHSISTLRAMRYGQGGVARSLEALEAQRWVRRINAEAWALTRAGLAEAERQSERQQEANR